MGWIDYIYFAGEGLGSSFSYCFSLVSFIAISAAFAALVLSDSICIDRFLFFFAKSIIFLSLAESWLLLTASKVSFKSAFCFSLVSLVNNLSYLHLEKLLHEDLIFFLQYFDLSSWLRVYFAELSHSVFVRRVGTSMLLIKFIHFIECVCLSIDLVFLVWKIHFY